MTKSWFEKKLEEFKGDPEFALESALLAFEEELVKNQVKIPEGFLELIERHFWELV